MSGITDPNVPSSLLKFWLRDLADPLIPNRFYEKCIRFAEDKKSAIEVIRELPSINQRVVVYTIDFLQVSKYIVGKFNCNINTNLF